MKVFLIKICKIQSLDLLFLVVFISFYASRYQFSQNFRTSLNIIWKKDCCHKFSFFNRFTQTPTPNPKYQIPNPLNGLNPQTMTKVFCQCSLFHMKITASVTKSSHQDRSPCYLHSPIFFPDTYTLLFCGSCDHCFPQQIRPQTTVQLYILQVYSRENWFQCDKQTTPTSAHYTMLV